MDTESKSAGNAPEIMFSAAPVRQPLSEAPAFFILLPLALSLFLCGVMPPPAAALSALFSSAAVLFFCTREIKKGFFPVFAAVMLASAALCALSLHRVCAVPDLPGSVEGQGRVLSVQRRRYDSALLISSGGRRYLCRVKGKDVPREGGTVYMRGAVFALGSRGKGSQKSARYWRAKGAEGEAVLFEIREISPPKGIPRWRMLIAEYADERLMPLSAAYITAFTAGIRDPLVYEPHKRAGTAHLFAVSGLHVWTAAALILFFLPRRGLLRFAAVSAAVWFYVFIAGLPPGGIRAALMLQMILLSEAAGRPRSAFNNVSAALLLMLLYDPMCFYDTGWRLSAAGALFVSASAPLFGRSRLSFICIPVLLWFVTAPVAASVFGEVPLAGLVLNIAAVPAFAVIFPLVLLLSLPPLLALPGSAVAASASEAILTVFQEAIERGAELFSGALIFDSALFMLSVFIFSAVCALRCGAGLKRSAAAALIFMFFMTYSAAM